MTADTENLMRNILKRIQTDVSDIKRSQSDMREPIASLEGKIGPIHRDIARLDVRLDQME